MSPLAIGSSQPLARVESLFWQVGGRRVHARCSAEPAPAGRLPLVLVHGLMSSSRWLVPTIAALGGDFPVFAPDLPGFGESESPAEPLDPEGLARALLDWMDAAGLERVALLGSSSGCKIALLAARARPEQIERLVLQGPALPPEDRTPLRALLSLALSALREPLGLLALLARDCWRVGRRRLAGAARSVVDERLEDLLPALRTPTLVVSGDRDPLSPPAWGAELAGQLLLGRRVVLEGASHTAVYSAPRLLARAVRPFLANLPVPPRVMLPGPPPRGLAELDAATSLVRASAAALHREQVSSQELRLRVTVARQANRLPPRIAERAAEVAAWQRALPAEQLGSLDAEALRRWVCASYPQRRFPAVFLGATNGAALHLSAALDAPWLPQTFLVPVRREWRDVDDLAGEEERGRVLAEPLLEANRDVQVCHVHDPTWDRLTLRGTFQLRLKSLRLGRAYEQLLAERVEPGGTIYLVECGQHWLVRRMSERHLFQAGGVGALPAADFYTGSPAVTEFLDRRESTRRFWTPLAPTEGAPEAEWGFEPALRSDVQRVARRLGLRVCRLVFPEVLDLSPAVADLLGAWYAELGRPRSRLLVESSGLVAPHWGPRRGCVPFWTHAPVEPAARAVEEYLRGRRFAGAAAFLSTPGFESAGLVPPARWRDLLAPAGDVRLLGVDPAAWPRETPSRAGHLRALREELEVLRLPPPPRLSLQRLERHFEAAGSRYRVQLSTPELAAAALGGPQAAWLEASGVQSTVSRGPRRSRSGHR